MQVQNVFEPSVTDKGRMGPSFKLRLTGTRVRFITARTTNWKSFESIGLPTHDEAENCVKFFQLIFYLYSFHECNEKLKEGIMYSILLFLNCLIKIQIRFFLWINSHLLSSHSAVHCIYFQYRLFSNSSAMNLLLFWPF